jgi:dTDP-4-dehydrorhamnose reductase
VISKILILGASGLIGIPLTKKLRSFYQIYTTYNRHKFFQDSIKLDICSSRQLSKLFHDIQPDIVINLCGIYQNLDFCENNKNLVLDVNSRSLISISKLCNEFNSHLISISSDHVFDGSQGNYKEEDVPSPYNFYGESRLLGEKNIRSYCKNYCIVRTSMIFGKNPNRETLSEWILNAPKNNEKLKLINDQFMTPTYLPNFCNMLKEVIDSKYTQILHLAGPEKISRYEFAVKLFEKFNLDKNFLIPVSKKSFNFSKNMPFDSSLNTDKANMLLKNKPQNLDKSIENYFESNS